MSDALTQQVNGNDKWCLTPFSPFQNGRRDPVLCGDAGHWKQIQQLLTGIDTCRTCRAKAKPTGSCTP